MKKALLFGLVAFCATVGFSDDLLDGVLYWDKPAAAPQMETGPGQTPAPTGSDVREERLRRQLEDAERRAAAAEEALLEAKKDAGAGEVAVFPDLHAEQETEDGDSGMAETESRARLGARIGFGGEKGVGLFAGDLLWPLGKNPFDLGVRGFVCMVPVRRGGSTEHLERPGGEVLGLWRPLRGETLSPYAGIGGRVETVGGFAEGDEESTEFSVAWRVGLALNFGRFSLSGEASGGTESTEFCGVAGFRLTEHAVLNAFVGRFDFKDDDGDAAEGKTGNGASMGGGLTWVF